MPIKWTDQAHLTLLLKLLEVNPITKFDTEAISATWPGAEKPTPRAIYEQIKNLRKRAEANSNGGSVSKASGAGKVSSNGNSNGALKFRASKPAATTSSGGKKSDNGSAAKKRKFNLCDDESEAAESDTVTDADADADAEFGSGNGLARNLPVRKSRTANYNLDQSDSEGLLDAAAKISSDSDSAFAPERSEKTRKQMNHGNIRAGENGEDEREQHDDVDVDEADEAFKMFTRGTGYDQVDGAADRESRYEDVVEIDSGEDADVDDDGARSMTTMATRRTSWATACEGLDEY